MRRLLGDLITLLRNAVHANREVIDGAQCIYGSQLDVLCQRHGLDLLEDLLAAVDPHEDRIAKPLIDHNHSSRLYQKVWGSNIFYYRRKI